MSVRILAEVPYKLRRSFRLSGYISATPTGGTSVKFSTGDSFMKCGEYIQIKTVRLVLLREGSTACYDSYAELVSTLCG